MTTKDVLKERYDEFLAVEFPNDSQDDLLSELHARLAEHDSFIAGHISSLLNGAKVFKRDLKYNVDLRRELNRQIEQQDKRFNQDAVAYLRYFEKLEELIEIARLIAL